jgi:hypothetical protein
VTDRAMAPQSVLNYICAVMNVIQPHTYHVEVNCILVVRSSVVPDVMLVEVSVMWLVKN